MSATTARERVSCGRALRACAGTTQLRSRAPAGLHAVRYGCGKCKRRLIRGGEVHAALSSGSQLRPATQRRSASPQPRAPCGAMIARRRGGAQQRSPRMCRQAMPPLPPLRCAAATPPPRPQRAAAPSCSSAAP